jgi:hypothetical protein
MNKLEKQLYGVTKEITHNKNMIEDFRNENKRLKYIKQSLEKKMKSKKAISNYYFSK